MIFKRLFHQGWIEDVESSEEMITFVATKKLYRFIGVTALNLGCALHFIFPEYEDQNI